MTITKLYLDMDGVIADFNQNLQDFGVIDNETHFIHKPREQWTESQKDLDRRVRGVMELEDFWPSIPPCPDAYELWDYVKQFDLYILTATPNVTEFRDRIAEQKRAWIQSTFGAFPQERILICLRAEKQAHSAPGHLLIDDMTSNCTEWLKGGGNSIMHSTAKNTIQHIREYHYV